MQSRVLSGAILGALFALARGASAQAAAASEPAPKASEGAASKEPEDSPHFRFGLGLDGNYLVASGLQGAAIGIQLRLGAQINQWSAVYYQAHALAGGVVGGSTGGGLLGGVYNSILGELTLPVLHLGAGPSIDVLGIAGCTVGGGCDTDSGAHFGLDARAALVLGGHGPGRHGGFFIDFDAHPTFVSGDALTTLSVGIGGEMY